MANIQLDFSHTHNLLVSDQQALLNTCDHLREIDGSSIISATVDKYPCRGQIRRIHLSATLWMRWLKNLLNNGKQIIPVATYQEAGEDCSYWEVSFNYMDCYIFCIGSVQELKERGIDIDG